MDPAAQKPPSSASRSTAATAADDDDDDDEPYADVRKQFSDRELVDPTLAIIAINGWNRLAISFRTPPGTYQPQAHAKGD